MAGARCLGIEDILSKPSRHKAASTCLLDKEVTGSSGSPRSSAHAPASPLCALKELATKTFKSFKVSMLQVAEDFHYILKTRISCFRLSQEI
ncbi:UNVERIFIED_CONTAM: hypothetical protein K2H54_034761 [Gekko kuhli]